MTESRRFTQGESYDEGTRTYYRFTNHSVTWARFEPVMLAARKTHTSGWRYVRPDWVYFADAEYDAEDPRLTSKPLARVRMPSASEPLLEIFAAKGRPSIAEYEQRTARKKFLQGVEPALREAVVKKFGDERNWHVAGLVRRSPAARDMLLDPGDGGALLFAWASSHVFFKNTHPQRAARTWLTKKRVEQLRRLGFPGRPAVERLLRKMVIPEKTGPRRRHESGISQLLYWRQTLNGADGARALKRAGHLKRITPAVTRFLTDPLLERSVGQLFLEELSAMTPKEAGETLREFQDFRNLNEELGHARIPSLRDMAALKRLHDRAIDDFSHERYRYDDAPLPAPPLAAWEKYGAKIFPLTTTRQIFDWGSKNHICIVNAGDFAGRIVRSHHAGSSERLYLYGMLPMRATVMIQEYAPGRFAVDEIRGPSNNRCPEARRVAELWLKEVAE